MKRVVLLTIKPCAFPLNPAPADGNFPPKRKLRNNRKGWKPLNHAALNSFQQDITPVSNVTDPTAGQTQDCLAQAVQNTPHTSSPKRRKAVDLEDPQQIWELRSAVRRRSDPVEKHNLGRKFYKLQRSWVNVLTT